MTGVSPHVSLSIGTSTGEAVVLFDEDEDEEANKKETWDDWLEIDKNDWHDQEVPIDVGEEEHNPRLNFTDSLVPAIASISGFSVDLNFFGPCDGPSEEEQRQELLGILREALAANRESVRGAVLEAKGEGSWRMTSKRTGVQSFVRDDHGKNATVAILGRGRVNACRDGIVRVLSNPASKVCCMVHRYRTLFPCQCFGFKTG